MADETSDKPTGERREHERHLVCAAAGLQRGEAGAKSALLCDISLTGALLLTRMRLEAGDTIKLVIPLAESDHDLAEANHDREVETTAKIVRSDPLPPERADLWKREVAVRFEEPLGDYEQEFKKLAVLAKAAGFPY